MAVGVSGKCICKDGWYGMDCSIEKDFAPVLVKPPAPMVCDVSRFICDFVTINGKFAETENLMCRFTKFEVSALYIMSIC